MYDQFGFFFWFYSWVLNNSNWILPHENAEARDRIKSTLGSMYQTFIYSMMQKEISLKMLWGYLSLKLTVLKK